MYRGWNGGWATGGQSFGLPWGSLALGLLFIALIALMVLAIIKMNKASRIGQGPDMERGVDILIERYVRGEIDAEAFRTMKAELVAKN